MVRGTTLLRSPCNGLSVTVTLVLELEVCCRFGIISQSLLFQVMTSILVSPACFHDFGCVSQGVRVAGGSSVMFIDPSTLRRSATAANVVAAAQQAAAASHEPQTMATTASCLARAFSIVIRQIADLLTMLQDYNALTPVLPRTLEITYQESINLQVCFIFGMAVFLHSFNLHFCSHFFSLNLISSIWSTT